MPVFRYRLEHNAGEAFGDIEAPDSVTAEEMLKNQYTAGDGFVDDEGNNISPKIVSINLVEVRPPEEVLIELREEAPTEESTTSP